MRRHLGSTALSALLALTPVPGAAQVASDPADAFSLVARAIEARHSLRYVARQDIVLVPPADSAGAPPSSLTQIVTDVTRDGRRVRLVYWLPCDATHRVVVDDGRLFRQWEPARRTILVDQSHEETAAAGRRMLALLHRNYRCLLLRRQRVNSLPCDLVAVRPRRGPAPSRLLWIERGRYAILRTEEYDGGGRRRYFSFYEAFRFVARVPARAFSLPQAGRIRPISHPVRDVAEPGAAFAAAGVAGRLPAWLPPGYVLVGCAVSGRRNKAALLRYGDGLKTVSVFEEAGRDAEDPLSRQETLRRELARYGQQAWVRHEAGLRITVVGDASLSDDLGGDLLRALSPESEARLARGLDRDFGDGPPQAAPLRRRGWDYAQIAALHLYLQAHPYQKAAVAGRLQHGQDWPRIAADLHADTTRLDENARRWIASTLNVP